MIAPPEAIEQSFREKVCAQIQLFPQGQERYLVFTPFMFDDGDHLVIVLKREGNQWILSDEGHTFMRLSYDLDEAQLQQPKRQNIISNALSVFGASDRHGEIIMPVQDDEWGDALFSFCQALLKIGDVTYLSPERVRSTFMEDLKALLCEIVPPDRLIINWHDPASDPQELYTVDYRVNGMPKPLFVFALNNDDRTKNATIALLHFEQIGLKSHSLGIYEDSEAINHKAIARFMDVSEKQFSSLMGNEDRIKQFIHELLRVGLPA